MRALGNGPLLGRFERLQSGLVFGADALPVTFEIVAFDGFGILLHKGFELDDGALQRRGDVRGKQRSPRR